MAALREAIERAFPVIQPDYNFSSHLLQPESIETGDGDAQLSELRLSADNLKLASLTLGETFIRNNPIHSIGIVSPSIPDTILDAAIAATKADLDKPYKPDPLRKLVIATDETAEKLKSAVPTIPVIASSEIKGLIKDEAYRRYGVTPEEDTEGYFLTAALIIENLILARTRGEKAVYDHLHTIDAKTPKVLPSPIKAASMLADTPNMIYVQRNFGNRDFSVGKSEENQKHPMARALNNLDLEPSSNVVMQEQFLNHVPLTTGRCQDLVNLVVAYEIARDTGQPVGKVIDEMGITPDVTELIKRQEDEYEKLLQIVEEEVHAKGGKLYRLTKEQLQSLNTRTKEIPGIGEFLPSLYTLLIDNDINLDVVYQLEKKLNSRTFPGIPLDVINWQPTHMSQPGVNDTPAAVATQLDQAIQDQKRKPVAVEVAIDTNQVVKDKEQGIRLREGDQKIDDTDPRKGADDLYQGLFFYNPGKRFLEQVPRIEAVAKKFLKGKTFIIPAWLEFDGWDAVRAVNEFSPRAVILASPDEVTLKAAARHCVAINQNDMLPFIKIDKLKDLGIIPRDYDVQMRGKGWTMLMSILYGMANDLIRPGEYIGHMDSDISNADDKGLAYLRDEVDIKERPAYKALLYLGAAGALMPPAYRAVAIQPAKVGVPRKGEVKHPTFQHFTDSPDPFIRMVGYGLGRVVWPSPGESLVLSDLYLQYPFQVTTGFDLNRYYATIVRELLKNGIIDDNIRDVFVQVNIPPDKIENVREPVPDKNDFREVNWAEKVIGHGLMFYQKLYYEQLARNRLKPLLTSLDDGQRKLIDPKLLDGLSPVLPPSMTIPHIIEYNAEHAGAKGRVLAPDYPESTRNLNLGDANINADLGRVQINQGVLTIDGGATILFPKEENYGAGGPNDVSYRYDPFYVPSPEWLTDPKNDIVDLPGIRKYVKPVSPIRTRRTRFEE